MEAKDLIRTRPISSYTKEDLENIKLLSFSKNGAIPFGSATYVQQKYPGDLDLYEPFIKIGSIEQVIRQFAKILQGKVRKIIKLQCHWITEIKAGVDDRFDLSIGTLINGVYIKNIDNIIKMCRLIPMDSEESENILNTISNPSFSRTQNAYEIISGIFRERKILRWTPDDILKGTLVKNERKFTLVEALHAKSHIKIDTIAFLDGRWTEITNFLFIAALEDGKIQLINTSYDFTNPTETALQYEDTIKEDIEKLFYSSDFNPFKGTKRMWAFARLFSRVDLGRSEGNPSRNYENVFKNVIKKITPLVSGNVSMIYQIKSEIDAVLLVLPSLEGSSICMDHLQNQVDRWKLSLSHVVEFNNDEIMSFIQLVENIEASYSSESFELLKAAISKKVNELTIQELKRLNLYPIPSLFLPLPRHFL